MIVSFEDSYGHAAARVSAPDSAEQQQITDAVTAITERRAIIEQAKGMLMLAYGIDADAAFALLRHQSQHHNVKLHLIAEQITTDLLALTAPISLASRLGVDGVLRTVHQRIDNAAD